MTWIFFTARRTAAQAKSESAEACGAAPGQKDYPHFFTVVLPLVREMGKREISVPLQTLCPPVCP